MSSTLLSNLSIPSNNAAMNPPEKLDARIVLLTHYIPLYQVRLFQEIANHVRDFQILLSTPLEPNRQFQPDWRGLNVTVQQTLTIQRNWRHHAGFNDPLYVHVPYDTWGRLRQLKPDIVLSLELGFRSTFAALYRMLHPRSRLVIATYMSEHTEQGRGWLRRCLRRWLIRRADVLTYNGPSCLRYLMSLGVSPSKLTPLPYAADDRTQHNGLLARDAQQRRRMLYIGQLSERKGIVPCLRQLSDYARLHPDQKFELRLVGAGPLESTLRASPIPPNLQLQFLGNIPAENLAEQMADCGVLILPTLADEWAVVVNEALQAGLLIIGSRLAQAVETLVAPVESQPDQSTGWTYDPREPHGLSQALDAFYATPDSHLETMRASCRSAVADRTPANAAQQALEALRLAWSTLHSS